LSKTSFIKRQGHIGEIHRLGQVFCAFLLEVKMNKQQKADIKLQIIGLIMGLPAWILLYLYDWKLALLMFFLTFSNNISQRTN